MKNLERELLEIRGKLSEVKQRVPDTQSNLAMCIRFLQNAIEELRFETFERERKR